MSPFLADSIPFLMADGTSLAFPTPNPTTPWPSPTTTSALKLRFLPPLTTLVTRLIDTTVSLMSSCDGSIFSRMRCMLKLQPAFSSCVGDRLNPAVIQIAVAIEYNPGDAFVLQTLGDCLADE